MRASSTAATRSASRTSFITVRPARMARSVSNMSPCECQAHDVRLESSVKRMPSICYEVLELVGEQFDRVAEDADVDKRDNRPDLQPVDRGSRAVQVRIDVPVELDAHVHAGCLGNLPALRSKGRRLLQHLLQRRDQLFGNVNRGGQSSRIAAAQRAHRRTHLQLAAVLRAARRRANYQEAEDHCRFKSDSESHDGLRK